MWQNLAYAIDVYSNILGEQKVYLLRFSTKKGEAKNLVPPFLEFVKDVQGEKAYKLREIAKKKE